MGPTSLVKHISKDNLGSMNVSWEFPSIKECYYIILCCYFLLCLFEAGSLYVVQPGTVLTETFLLQSPSAGMTGVWHPAGIM